MKNFTLRPRPVVFSLAIIVFFGCVLYAFNAAAQSNFVFFSVGKGYTDGIPRQLVRTNGDRLYIFTPNAQYNTQINAFWTTGTGLPSNAAAFTGPSSFNESANPLSVDAVYDGGTIIHVLINTTTGLVKDHPFDTSTNTFKSAITIASNAPTVSGDYIGTSGISGMYSTDGLLHIAYWSNGNHITHQAYSYNSTNNTLTASGGSTQVDTAGSATHPAIAISPLDGSLTVAWVSEVTVGGEQILARKRNSNGTWGSVEVVSATIPWTSRNAGVNIDQGPSLIITRNGTRHLLYIEDYDGPNSYGHVHYVTNSGSGWTDTALNLYSHNPGLATNYADDIYLIGHGRVSTGENVKMYIMKKNSNGNWGSPQEFAVPPSGGSFDASPSIKWSVVGFNRSETVEFAFFTPIGNNYNNTNIYYGRFDIGGGAPPPATATPTPTLTPSNTPTSTPTLTPQPVTPTSPPNSTPAPAFFAVRRPTLTWNRISWAVGYQIQVDDDPNFGSPVPVADEFSSTTFSYTLETDLSDGRYYWRVRAKKNDTLWGDWSPKETFLVSAP